MRKLYVGNLPYSVNEDKLNETFSKFGKVVSASIATDRDTGRSRGFGFIEMEKDENAETAMNEMQGSSLEGRTLTVNYKRSKPRPDFNQSYNH